MQGHDFLHHRKANAEPRAASGVPAACLGKNVEDPRQQFGTNALAIVLDMADEMRLFAGGSQPEAATWLGVLDGIVEPPSFLLRTMLIPLDQKRKPSFRVCQRSSSATPTIRVVFALWNSSLRSRSSGTNRSVVGCPSSSLAVQRVM